jgi:hypothetical protein
VGTNSVMGFIGQGLFITNEKKKKKKKKKNIKDKPEM